MGKVLANVKVFVGSLAARGTSLASILSSLVDVLPSKDFNSFTTSLLSVPEKPIDWTQLCGFRLDGLHCIQSPSVSEFQVANTQVNIRND